MRDRALGSALALSILLHAVVLSIHFKFPDALRWKSVNTPLEVVLVNAKTRDRPTRADVLAQANLDRGGNVDQDRRAKTPLPVVEPRRPGKDLADAQRRVQQLEAQQQRMLAQEREHRSEEHTSDLQPHSDLVCRLLLEKKKTRQEAHDLPHAPGQLHSVKENAPDPIDN